MSATTVGSAAFSAWIISSTRVQLVSDAGSASNRWPVQSNEAGEWICKSNCRHFDPRSYRSTARTLCRLLTALTLCIYASNYHVFRSVSARISAERHSARPILRWAELESSTPLTVSWTAACIEATNRISRCARSGHRRLVATTVWPAIPSPAPARRAVPTQNSGANNLFHVWRFVLPVAVLLPVISVLVAPGA